MRQYGSDDLAKLAPFVPFVPSNLLFGMESCQTSHVSKKSQVFANRLFGYAYQSEECECDDGKRIPRHDVAQDELIISYPGCCRNLDHMIPVLVENVARQPWRQILGGSHDKIDVHWNCDDQVRTGNTHQADEMTRVEAALRGLEYSAELKPF